MDRLSASRVRHPDVWSGAALLAVAVGYGAVALGLPRGGDEPGPGALPLLYAVLLGVVAGSLLARGLKGGVAAPGEPAQRTPPADAAGADAGGAPPVAGPDLRRPALAALATLAYAALFEPVGFVLATPLYTAAIGRLFTRDGRALGGLALAVTTALFVFFRIVLGVRLPAGPLG